jgi:hypothetical protein
MFATLSLMIARIAQGLWSPSKNVHVRKGRFKMHVTSKEIDENGTHIITSVIEGDGAVELASPNAKLQAKVISLQRTASGGVQVQTAVFIDEPAPAPARAAPAPEAPAMTAEASALEYLKEKGLTDSEAQSALARYGSQEVLIRKQAERKAELDALLSPSK